MPNPHDEPLHQAFLKHRRAHGQAATRRILDEVIGPGWALEDADEKQRAKLLRAFNREAEQTEEPDPSALLNRDGTLNHVAIYARFNRRVS